MSRRTTLPPAWRALAESAGGVAALAESLGVSTGTLWAWGAGTRRPGKFARESVRAWARRRGLREPF